MIVICGRLDVSRGNEPEWLCGFNRTISGGLTWFLCPLNVPSLFNVCSFLFLISGIQSPPAPPKKQTKENHPRPLKEAMTVLAYKKHHFITLQSQSRLHLPRSVRCCSVAWWVLPLKWSPSTPTAMIVSILSWDEIKVLGGRDINLL